ncbi:exocyst complex component EXO70B1-like [Abrus precatorius]|uniref:Exocyst subunit Exo70 family protein n=1 Tax=Abrus precatorius TaxID=3816 RepID=A0A8B8L4E1_ABRPR|nr:exocyst complex component EXO70B1-like [Abrus precatorius]
MDKNLAENSGSFVHRDEPKNAGDTPHSPPKADPKPDGDTAKAEPPAPTVHHGGNREEKEEAVECPLPSLEKVSEDIDQLLVTLQWNHDDDKDSNKGNAERNIEIPGFVERYLDLVEEKIVKYDTGEGKAKWVEVVEEDSWLLETVHRISKLMNLLTHHNEPKEGNNGQRDSLVNRIGSIQQRAMSYLEEDFRLLMEESRNPTELDPGGNNQNNNNDSKGKQVASEQQDVQDHDHQQPESETTFPGYPEEAIASLRKIAAEMLSGGYESECCQVYIISRRNAFEEILQKLGLERISIDEMVQKVQWETLARDMIPAWINTFKQCAAVYFPGERRLAETVFADNPSVAAGLYSSLSRGVVIQLLNFAEGGAMTKRAGEKLFKLLDMYETLRDVIPKLDGLFPEESVEELKTEMNLAKLRLGEAAISIFCDLENSIKSETAKTAVPGGAVHPLTRYIMNYLNIAGDYKETLEQVFKEYSKIERADSTSNARHENGGVWDKGASSPFTAQVMRVMELLDASLDGKARLYRDVSLSNFFMMNNGRYILQKIKGSHEMSQVMGDTWCRKKSSELRTYHKNYQRETWNRVLACLNQEGLNVNGKVYKPALKERFKSFNAMFDEIHRTQSTWVVKDEQLQSELRVSVSSVVIPAYRSFIGRFSQYLDPGRQTEKYIKYQAEDIETYIDELFDGKPHQSIARRKT